VVADRQLTAGLRVYGGHTLATPSRLPIADLPNFAGKIPSAVADDLGSDQCIRLYLIYMDIV